MPANGSAAKTKIASLTSFYQAAFITYSRLGKFNLAHEMRYSPSIPFLFGFSSSRTQCFATGLKCLIIKWSFSTLKYNTNRILLCEGIQIDTTFHSQLQSWVGHILCATIIFCTYSL